jgi:hypothetical protein
MVSEVLQPEPRASVEMQVAPAVSLAQPPVPLPPSAPAPILVPEVLSPEAPASMEMQVDEAPETQENGVPATQEGGAPETQMDGEPDAQVDGATETHMDVVPEMQDRGSPPALPDASSPPEPHEALTPPLASSTFGVAVAADVSSSVNGNAGDLSRVKEEETPTVKMEIDDGRGGGEEDEEEEDDDGNEVDYIELDQDGLRTIKDCVAAMFDPENNYVCRFCR